MCISSCIYFLLVLGAFSADLIGSQITLTAGDNPRLSLRLEDKGRTIFLSPGEAFCILLDADLSTGYRWHVLEIDTRIVEQGKIRFQASTRRLGGKANQILFFKAINCGETRLSLGYRRQWEEQEEPLDIFSIVIKVRIDASEGD